MTDDYAPFPEGELEALALYHDRAAANWKSDTQIGQRLRAEHELHAKTCRDAVAAHIAVRERCLIAEMDNRQAKAS